MSQGQNVLARLVFLTARKYKNVSSSPCQSCPPGSFNNRPGATSIAECISCHKGQTMNGTRNASGCVPCDPGTYKDVEGGSLCKSCPAKTYSEKRGVSQCVSVPDGYEVANCSAAGGNCTTIRKSPNGCSSQQYLDDSDPDPARWKCAQCLRRCVRH